MKALRFLLTFTLLSSLLSNANAQSTFGSIVGVVQDPSQATIAGALVKVRNLDENTSHTAASDTEGNFQFLNLKPGRYEITATRSGFADFKIPELQLDARQSLRIEVKLQLAQIGESVQVSGSDTAINTENATIGASISGKS